MLICRNGFTQWSILNEKRCISGRDAGPHSVGVLICSSTPTGAGAPLTFFRKENKAIRIPCGLMVPPTPWLARCAISLLSVLKLRNKTS